MEYAIETQNLSMVFRAGFWGIKKIALDGLTLQVRRNEIFGFLGHNGAGKTTTIKLLVGLCRPSGGTARIAGNDISSVAARQRVGFLPENAYFYEYLNGLESVEFYGRLHGLPRSECRQRAAACLSEVGLGSAMHQAVREYSKGMKQRLGLASAMVHDPEILILDEPLTGLDPVGRRQLRDKILDLKERGKTVFYSSHILPDVEMTCDRVALLTQGKLIAVGRLDELLGHQVISVEVVGQGFTEEGIQRIKPLAQHIFSDGPNTVVMVQDETQAGEVKSVLENGGGVLKALIPHRESLEDYYLRQSQGVTK